MNYEAKFKKLKFRLYLFIALAIGAVLGLFVTRSFLLDLDVPIFLIWIIPIFVFGILASETGNKIRHLSLEAEMEAQTEYLIAKESVSFIPECFVESMIAINATERQLRPLHLGNARVFSFSEIASCRISIFRRSKNGEKRLSGFIILYLSNVDGLDSVIIPMPDKGNLEVSGDSVWDGNIAQYRAVEIVEDWLKEVIQSEHGDLWGRFSGSSREHSNIE